MGVGIRLRHVSGSSGRAGWDLNPERRPLGLHREQSGIAVGGLGLHSSIQYPTDVEFAAFSNKFAENVPLKAAWLEASSVQGRPLERYLTYVAEWPRSLVSCRATLDVDSSRRLD
jgi:hypothetical protein